MRDILIKFSIHNDIDKIAKYHLPSVEALRGRVMHFSVRSQKQYIRY